MEILAIIPARGGSKGIPKKNIRPLNGKPLLAYTVEAARAAPSITRVVVSTDAPAIGVVAEQYGAEVVWRPGEISGDAASSELALLHALDHLRRAEGYQPELLVFLQCTSPLTLPEDIEGTIQVLLDEDADTALAVTPFHYFLWKWDAEGDAVGINHDKRRRPLRQECKPQYLETGAVYVMRVLGFLQARHRFFGRTAMYVMPPDRCLEIDEPVDLQVAEVLLQERRQQGVLQALPDPVAALVLDFDGVFTDNRVIVFQDGREAVVAHRGDGWGLSQLKARGLPILVLSTEQNPVVQARCSKLGLPALNGITEKWPALRRWLEDREIDPAGVVYVGNDLNDKACMEAVGCAVAVQDAHPEIKALARITLQKAGGDGAIREIVELILERMDSRPSP